MFYSLEAHYIIFWPSWASIFFQPLINYNSGQFDAVRPEECWSLSDQREEEETGRDGGTDGICGFNLACSFMSLRGLNHLEDQSFSCKNKLQLCLQRCDWWCHRYWSLSSLEQRTTAIPSDVLDKNWKYVTQKKWKIKHIHVSVNKTLNCAFMEQR